ncbi:MAG: amidohydrolase family protein [Planctomycetes bacterium]|nr:amidohydrolase family protein [Planctomycetota bacterium]
MKIMHETTFERSASIRTVLLMAAGVIGFTVPQAIARAAARGSAMTPKTIVAGGYVAPDGRIVSDVVIAIEDGKIKSVSTGSTGSNGKTADRSVLQRPDAIVSPGLIDLRAVLGAYGRDDETAFSIDPGASAVDIVDARHRDFRAAVRAGITTVLIAPNAGNLVSGAAVVLKTGGGAHADWRRDRLLREEGPLVFALGPRVWQPDRAPTSRAGSLSMLRAALRESAAGGGHDRLQRFMSGRLDGLVVCDDPMDVDSALAVLAGSDRRLTIVHTSDTHELGEALARYHAAIVMGPFDASTPPRVLAAPAALSAAGVEVAFAGAMPMHAGESLRITAALAVRYGMDPAKARLAITSVAARRAGVDGRVGTIEQGRDADLVLFSGDPLRLDSRVLEVYINGARVYSFEADNGAFLGDSQ